MSTASLAAAQWAVIPAAGSGERMGQAIPKQYLQLAGVAILQRTIDRLLSISSVTQAMVVLSPDDQHWKTLAASSDPRVHTVCGGDVRAESVAAGVACVNEMAGDMTWVLVHDAARPMVAVTDIERLIAEVMRCQAVGGLLALPVQDTLKCANDDHTIQHTVSRDGLWQAQTPQLFQAGPLLAALRAALREQKHRTGTANVPVTDEAAAMERLGHAPLLVEALHPNIKITRPADLLLAEAVLDGQSGKIPCA